MRRLLAPEHAQSASGLERLEPDVQTDGKGEDGTDEDEPAVDFEPGTVFGEDYGGDGEEEGREYEDGVYRAGCGRAQCQRGISKADYLCMMRLRRLERVEVPNSGHFERSRSAATVLSLGPLFSEACVIMTTTRMRPPQSAKRTSAPMKVRRILVNMVIYVKWIWLGLSMINLRRFAKCVAFNDCSEESNGSLKSRSTSQRRPTKNEGRSRTSRKRMTRRWLRREQKRSRKKNHSGKKICRVENEEERKEEEREPRKWKRSG